MKVQNKRLLAKTATFALVALLAGSLSLVGCSGSDDDSGSGSGTSQPAATVNLTAIALSQSAVTVEAGDTEGATVSVSYTPSNATNKTVTWTSSSDKVTVTTSNNGAYAVIKAAADAEVGATVTVTATPAANASLAKTVTVTVAKASTLSLSDVTLTPAAAELDQGKSVTVTANAVATDSDEGATVPEVTYAWSTSASGITLENASTSTVTIKAASDAAVGSAAVTVTATCGTKTKTATFTLTVNEADTTYIYDFKNIDYEAAESADWTTSTSGRYNPILATVDENTFLTVTGYESSAVVDSRNNNGCALTSPSYGVPAGKDYKLTFDVKIGGANNQASSFYIYDAAGTAADNVLVSIVQTGAASNKFYVNDTTNSVETEIPGMYATSSALGYNALENLTWYTIVLERAGTDTYLTIKEKAGSVVFARQKVEAASENGGLGVMKFNTGRYSANFAIDNVVIKTAKSVLTVTSPVITATVDGEAADAFACDGEIELSADASATYADGSTLGLIYSWKIDSTDYAYFGSGKASTTGPTVTLSADNASSIESRSINVSVTAVPNDSTEYDAAKTTSKTLTVKANDTLMSDVVLSAATAEVTAGGDTMTLTTTGAELAAAIKALTVEDGEGGTSPKYTVSYTWASSDTAKLSVTADETDPSKAVIAGLIKTDDDAPVTITVTARAGSVAKTATCAVTVLPSEAALETLTVDETVSIVLDGDKTLTATVNDALVPTYLWVSSDETTVKVESAIVNDDGSATATLSGLKVGTATVTLTATVKTVTLTKTIAVTVKESTKSVVKTYNFNDVDATAEGFDITAYATTSANTTKGWVSSIATSDNAAYGQYLKAEQGGTGARSWNTTIDLASGSDYYVLDFDGAIGTGNTNNAGGGMHQFTVASATKTNAEAVAYLMSLTCETANGSNNVDTFTWTIANAAAETKPTVALEEYKFYHFTLSVGKKVTLTITDGETTLADAVELTVAGTSTAATAFQMYGVRGLRGTVQLDNIVVSAIQ